MSAQTPQHSDDSAGVPQPASDEGATSGTEGTEPWRASAESPTPDQTVVSSEPSAPEQAPSAPTQAYPAAGYVPSPGYPAPAYPPIGYPQAPGYPLPGGTAQPQAYAGYPPAYPPGYPQPYGQPPNALPASSSPATSSSAIVALILAIASWLVCPLVPAIVALVFAARADREIRASGGTVQGGGLSMAAKVVSWINIGLYAAILLMSLVFVVVAVAIGALDASSGSV